MSEDVSYEFSIDVMFKIMNPRLNYIVIYFPDVASAQFAVDFRLYNDFASITTIVYLYKTYYYVMHIVIDLSKLCNNYCTSRVIRIEVI